tara:strand:- start:30 stop:470 length:441 start_codon:yes stop_codon:yes gene_type:complete
MTSSSNNPILIIASRLLTPFIQLFALYVIVHGHYGPGGGFQGGAMLAASIIFLRLSLGTEISQRIFKKTWGIPLGILGAIVFFSTGLLTLVFGGTFLEFNELALPGLSKAELHFYGILVVEIGVSIAVMSILISIFDDLSGESDCD